jgi:hypothetical protein
LSAGASARRQSIDELDHEGHDRSHARVSGYRRQMATRYQLSGWIDSVIEIRYTATVDEFFAFAQALHADPLVSPPHLQQLMAQDGPPVGALMEDQHESSAFFRLSCPAFIAGLVLAHLNEILREHMPPTPTD